MSEKKPVVLLAGGGTAGHVNPLLALARHLRDEAWGTVIIGTKEGKEAELLPEAGFEYTSIPRIPMPRKPSPALFTLPRRMGQTVRKIRVLLRENQIDAVVGFGGFVSTPAYLAARKEGVPVIIHEQNVRPGLANRLAARWARAVALTLRQTRLVARHGQTSFVGLPLRPEIAQLAKDRLEVETRRQRREVAAKRFGLDPRLPILLVTGGSLGALAINNALAAAAPKLPGGVQVLHLTGKGKDGSVREAAATSTAAKYVVLDYLVEMEEAFAAADLVVSRSGAGMVAELAAIGMPSVFVPLAIGNGEQQLNAADMVKSGGAEIVDNEEFTAGYVLDKVCPLLEAPGKLSTMSDCARRTGRIDAVGTLTDLISKVIGE